MLFNALIQPAVLRCSPFPLEAPHRLTVDTMEKLQESESAIFVQKKKHQLPKTPLLRRHFFLYSAPVSGPRLRHPCWPRNPLCTRELMVLFNCEAVVRHCWQDGTACQVQHLWGSKQTRVCSRKNFKRRRRRRNPRDVCTSHATGSRYRTTTNRAANA